MFKYIVLIFAAFCQVLIAQDGSAQLSLPWSTGTAYRMTQAPHLDNNVAGAAMDFNGSIGSSVTVHAARDGSVRYGGCAHSVWVDHADGWSTNYYHVTNKQVANGQIVTRGQTLGYTSILTCASVVPTGPHVHFSLTRYGAYQTLIGKSIGGWEVTANGMRKNGVTITDGGSVYNDGTIGAGNSAFTPIVTGVSPASPVPTGAAQSFTINGSNFDANATVTLRDSSNVYANRTVSFRTGSTQIVINPNFGTIPDNWRVEVLNGATSSGNFAFTVSAAGPILAVKPTSPTPSSGSSSQPRTPNLTWTTGANTTFFKIYLGTTSSLSTTNLVSTQGVQSPFFAPDTLNYSTTYYWRVDASNTAGTYTTGDVWNFTTEEAPVVLAGKPTSPTPSSGSASQPRTPNLTWTAGANTTYYKIYLGTTSSLSTPNLVSTQGVQFPFFGPDTLNYSTTYYWRVDASNAAGTYTTGDVWSFSTETAPVLLAGKPTNPTPASGTGNLSRTQRFTWTAGANTSLFRIYLGISSNLGNGTPTLTQTVQNAFLDPEGLNYGTTYYFRVDATNSEGTITTGDVWSFSTAPASYSVTISGGTGGTVSPNSSQTVTSGGSQTFTASPFLSYAVDQWTVNGVVAQAGGNSFTLSSISADRSVAVTFRLLGTSIVVTTVGVPLAGGSITGGGSYAAGALVSLQANPAAGYYFDGWASGASGLVNPLSLSLNANISIQAKFALVPPQLQLVQARFSSAMPQTFTTALVGPPANGITLQRSGDLRNWTDWKTVTVSPTGFAAVVDTAPFAQQGYYRIKPTSGGSVVSLNFDDNQIPAGWNLSFLSNPRVNGGAANQRLEAREVDTTALLTKSIPAPSASGSVRIQWNANIINNYWGMGSGMRIKMTDASIYTAYAGKQGNGIPTGRLMISHDTPEEIFLQENLAIPWGNYALEATFSQGTIRLKGTDPSSQAVVFDRNIATPSFNVNSIAAIEFIVINTTGPAAWIDDAVITITP